MDSTTLFSIVIIIQLICTIGILFDYENRSYYLATIVDVSVNDNYSYYFHVTYFDKINNKKSKRIKVTTEIYKQFKLNDKITIKL